MAAAQDEAAALRAKIQAMRNLLAAKRGVGARPSPVGAWGASASANRVWRRADGEQKAPAAGGGGMRPHKAWRRPLKASGKALARAMLVKRAQSRMQLQVLKLEDGEYSKANGGFSLVRSGVKKTAPAVSNATVTSTHKNSAKTISVGGVQYVVARGGKSIKRSALGDRGAPGAMSSRTASALPKTGSASTALQRAQVSIQKARATRLALKKRGVQTRTEYCRFYNRFGYCKNKITCKFIHDSRRVAMCRKFLRNECTDPKCMLSHLNDENKVPVCSLFLRGACTREGCKYLHIKVNANAALCPDFLSGYCSKGASCPLRHELAKPKKRAFTGIPMQQTAALVSAKNATLHSPGKSMPLHVDASAGAAVSNPSEKELSIRPNIRFAPRRRGGFSSLFDDL